MSERRDLFAILDAKAVGDSVDVTLFRTAALQASKAPEETAMAGGSEVFQRCDLIVTSFQLQRVPVLKYGSLLISSRSHARMLRPASGACCRKRVIVKVVLTERPSSAALSTGVKRAASS